MKKVIIQNKKSELYLKKEIKSSLSKNLALQNIK